MFKEDLVFLDIDSDNNFSLFREVVPELVSKGYTKEGYLDALITREEEYPTGLPTSPFGVAIPHADTKYVNKSGVAVVKPKVPIVFNEMGSLDGEIQAKFIFILLLEDGNSHIDMLQKMMDLFMDEAKMMELAGANNVRDVTFILNKYVGK